MTLWLRLVGWCCRLGRSGCDGFWRCQSGAAVCFGSHYRR
ncbi:hypothetical protein I551_7283 [Mycobacterium ulcerans str. Harvey]|uniref:Uncharacterized protein n=1 Tax=Mycobacterium ulcerans str. Harvey TaxID=1299332 RepID=A0ABN0QNP2_MYCUL|nr:hypothetical protein I551_7283 [Mycobacterium ulcerans str. Harvey]